MAYVISFTVPGTPVGKGLTADQLKQIVSYDKKTGVFTWLTRMGPRHPGEVAGTKCRRGYLSICIHRKIYKAHRLAWLYVYGVWPSGQVDHIDNNKSNNAIANLRDVDQALNQRNRRIAKNDSETGVLGVSRWPDGRPGFKAQITVDGRCRYIGTFETMESAHEAYLLAKKNLHKGACL
ncbi:HNH endonuclease signature motif containing protein [Paludibacterium purpuratum]|uniref:HNH endonuclease n=1 Tax=Paludibacterium purpuratum TaxID=1144873 RepID=A0A4R7BBB2_9NEIS|nr:HNH endonuclease signature motif containing protein [Paludibacterium purpuratum]TDR82188.1 HNH endonuclease [Paludibacterium purpuratum]